jgi:hypothetical protein
VNELHTQRFPKLKASKSEGGAPNIQDEYSKVFPAQSAKQLFRKQWNKKEKHLGRKLDMTKAWPQITAEFEAIPQNQRERLDARSSNSHTKSGIQRTIAKRSRSGTSKHPHATPVADQAPTASGIAEIEDSIMGISAPQNDISDDRFAMVPANIGPDDPAMPSDAQPKDMTQYMCSDCTFSQSSSPALGGIASAGLDIGNSKPFSAEIMENVFTQPDVDGRYHNYSDAVDAYKQQSERVELSKPFPDVVTYETQCGALCQCFTPPHIIDFQKTLDTYLDNLAKETSVTSKASHVSAKGVVLVGLQFRTQDESGGPLETFFATMTSALGSWHRFPASQQLVELTPCVGAQAWFSH